jgi:hypothetical protein
LVLGIAWLVTDPRDRDHVAEVGGEDRGAEIGGAVVVDPRSRDGAPEVTPERIAGAEVRRAVAASAGGRPLRASSRLGASDEPIEVGSGGSLELVLGHGSTLVAGEGSTFVLRTSTAQDQTPSVEVRDGTIEVAGELEVQGPECACRIAGRARVTVEPTLRTSVTRIAGDITVVPGRSCAITTLELDLPAPAGEESAPPAGTAPAETAPASPETAQQARVGRAPRSASSSGGAGAAEQESDPGALLAQRVDRFARARAMLRTDPGAALAELRALDAEWPSPPVRQELDLALIDGLLRTGQRDAARTAAERFVAEHGRPRRSEVIERALAPSP